MSKAKREAIPELGERGGWPAQNESAGQPAAPAKRAAARPAKAAQKSNSEQEG